MSINAATERLDRPRTSAWPLQTVALGRIATESAFAEGNRRLVVERRKRAACAKLIIVEKVEERC